MSADMHRVPGETLGERLSTRLRGERRVGPSPTFYARFGLSDPWMPEGPVGGQDRDFGLVYLSSAAFFDHLTRMAGVRERRVARHEAALARVARRPLGALRRAGALAKGSLTRGLAWAGGGALAEHEFIVPQHEQPVVAESEESAGAPVVRGFRGPSMRGVDNPWLSFPSKPARVFRASDRPAPLVVQAAAGSPSVDPRLGATAERTSHRNRPLDRVAQRVGAIDVQPARASRVATTPRTATESAPNAERRAVRAAVRQAARAIGPVARLSAPRLEAAASDSAASPLGLAASRLPQPGDRPRGVRRALFGSPSLSVVAAPPVEVVEAEVERAPLSRSPVTRTAAGARVVRGFAPRQGVASTARVVTRAAAAAAPTAAVRTARLAPVTRADGRVAPAVAPTASAARDAATPVRRATVDSLLPGPAARRPVARAVSPAAPAAEAPLARRAVATTRAVSRSRTMGADRLLPAPVVTDAVTPTPVARAAAHAADRVQSATSTGGSVVPRPVAALRGKLDAGTAEAGWLDALSERAAAPSLRRLSAARTASGAYAPAAVVVAHEDAGAPVEDATATPAGAPGARRDASGARVVSGWARNALPASSARVVRGAAHAEERLVRAARDATATEPARGPATRTAAARPLARVPSAAAARPVAAAATRDVAPAPSRGLAPARSRRPAARVAAPNALESALVSVTGGAPVAPGASRQAADRVAGTPAVARAARTAGAPQTREALAPRRARRNPLAHAGPGVVTETVRLNADLARRIRVVTEGSREAADRYLVGGATAERALSAARQAERGGTRGTRAWAPDMQVPESPLPVTVDAEGKPVPVPSAGGDAPRTVSGWALSSSQAARAHAGPAVKGRPLDWASDRSIAIKVVDVLRGEARPETLAPSIRAALPELVAAAMPTGTVPAQIAAARAAGLAPGRRPGATPAAARAGRHVIRMADGRYVPAPRARRGATARSAAAAFSDFTVPQAGGPVELDPGTGQPVGSESGSPRVVSGWARPQGALSETLSAVEDQKSDAHLPVWARRASGSPLVRGSEGDLVSALARATDPEQVVRVILEKGIGGSTPSTLPKPALQVIEQIKTVARDEVTQAIQAEVVRQAGAARQATRRGEAQRSTARVVQGFTGLRRSSSTRSSGGVGDDRVMKLAKKLQALIDLAEGTGNRDAARRQVRMAEDSAAARGEGQAAPATADGGQKSSVDIDALTREVVSAATRELDLRRERRQEDSDERGFWW